MKDCELFGAVVHGFPEAVRLPCEPRSFARTALDAQGQWVGPLPGTCWIREYATHFGVEGFRLRPRGCFTSATLRFSHPGLCYEIPLGLGCGFHCLRELPNFLMLRMTPVRFSSFLQGRDNFNHAVRRSIGDGI